MTDPDDQVVSARGAVQGPQAFGWIGFSETGKRERNEDCWGFLKAADGKAVWVVADGLGGHGAGDEASRIAVAAFLQAAAADTGSAHQAVLAGVSAARQAVVAMVGESASEKPASSTLVGLVLACAQAAVIHVGDSPLVQLRSGKVVFRTRDHNVREMLRAIQQPSSLPASEDPDASRLTRSLAQVLEGEESVASLDVLEGDLILLCSDGVSQHFPDDLGKWTARDRDEFELIARIRSRVAQADHPRQDNYTAIVVRTGGSIGTVQRGGNSLSMARIGLLVLLLLLAAAAATVPGFWRMPL